MPAAIKDWYIRNNKTEMLTPLNYNNYELSDIWDMEMVSETAPIQPKIDTLSKIDTFQKNKVPPAPIPVPQKNKENALTPSHKKKKHISKQNDI